MRKHFRKAPAPADDLSAAAGVMSTGGDMAMPPEPVAMTPAEAAASSSQADAENIAEPASSSALVAPGTPAGTKAGNPKIYKSPEELLKKLSPPLCTFHLDHNLHRWSSSFKLAAAVHEKLPFPYNQKTMTCSFNQQMTWQQALKRVHDWNWSKFQKLLAIGAAESPAVQQQPGVIPAEIIADLQESITNLPPYKKYGRKS